jgi:predicted TIM-barrel fold metal-dependent hydrolase
MMYNGVQCEFPPGYDGTVLLERLQHILDPELDESILQLGFVQSLHVYDGHATIVVQLPTSWCAANFAYMMADDTRRALLTVEGIHHVTVRLRDHFAAEAIETAVNSGKPFTEAFPGEGCGSLTALRVTFLHKGFTSRQERLLRDLHVPKGPTVYPLSRDAFDVHDVDYAATDFPDLNFIIEHIGLPRLEDFCWIATQESNVYAGLSVTMAFSRLRPQYFAEIMANLLFWLGPDKLCFGSDYAIWSPKWLIEKFMAFELPDEIKKEYGVDLTLEIKRKILGENAARLYGIDIALQQAKLRQDRIGVKLATVA